jgi:hypothetical protein
VQISQFGVELAAVSDRCVAGAGGGGELGHKSAAPLRPGSGSITRLAGMAERFATTLDCAGISFLHDGTLDELPLTSEHCGTRRHGPEQAADTGGHLCGAGPYPLRRAFTVLEHAAKVASMTGLTATRLARSQ